MEEHQLTYQNSTVGGSSIDEQQQRNNTAPEKKKSSCPWGKILLGIVLLSIIILVIIDSSTTKYIAGGFTSFLTWIETHVVAGVFAFMGVYFVATVAFVPGSILTLGGGFVFGKALGLGPGVALASAAVFVGASLGAIASFLLGRYLLRDWVVRTLVKKYPVIKALDVAFRENGLRIFVLIRLSPIFPFNAINYIGGVTSMKLSHYVLALLGMLPGTVLYCFIGSTAGSLTESENAVNGPVSIASIVVGIVFGLFAVFAASYYAKKEFSKIVAEQEQRDREQEGFAEEVPETNEMA